MLRFVPRQTRPGQSGPASNLVGETAPTMRAWGGSIVDRAKDIAAHRPAQERYVEHLSLNRRETGKFYLTEELLSRP